MVKDDYRIKRLEEIMTTLSGIDNNDYDCVSLYDIENIIKKTNNEYNNIIKQYQDRIDYFVNKEFSCISNFFIYDFDHSTNILHTKFDFAGNSQYQTIDFKLKDGILCISKSDSCWTKEVFSLLGTELLNLCNELVKFSDYKNQSAWEIKSVNSKFYVDILPSGILVSSIISSHKRTVESLLSSNHLPSKSDYNFNMISEKRNEILKKIYIKNYDCPEWFQINFKQTMQGQLFEKEKRLKMLKKYFPF